MKPWQPSAGKQKGANSRPGIVISGADILKECMPFLKYSRKGFLLYTGFTYEHITRGN